MRAKGFMVALILVFSISVPLFAHHGNAVFESGKVVVLKGTVVKWLYANPHLLLTLDTKGDNGEVVQWIVESQSPTVMYPFGWHRDSFKPGDQVTVRVTPVKNGRPVGSIIDAVTADGTKLAHQGPQARPAAAETK